MAGRLYADWPGARGHFALVFKSRLHSELRSAFSLGLRLSALLFPSTAPFIMDVPEPEQSPFTAVSAQTSKLTRVSPSMKSIEGLRTAHGLHSLFGAPGCLALWVLTNRRRNTKPTSTPRPPIPPIAGWAPVSCSSFSSCALFSLKDGTLVRFFQSSSRYRGRGIGMQKEEKQKKGKNTSRTGQQHEPN